jgi:hypothetical protein
MTDRPIMFSAPMVRALTSGTKTQTRRALSRSNTLFNGDAWPKQVGLDNCNFAAAWVDDGPSPAGNAGPYLKAFYDWGQDCDPLTDNIGVIARIYPRVHPGDRLWVREHWRTEAFYNDLSPAQMSGEEPLLYIADGDKPSFGRHRNSMFMPRWASRISLTVTDVRIELLQDISEPDAIAEGCPYPNAGYADRDDSSRSWFKSLWNHINGPGAWDSNPWVLAYTFEVQRRNIDQC